MKQLYIIQYQSAHWCGGIATCVVWANSEKEATDKAECHMEDEMHELFADEIEEEDLAHEPQAVVDHVQCLVGHNLEEYYNDENHCLNFYPCVNPEDAP